MFTGIVEQSLRVIGVAAGPAFARLTLASDWTDVASGESVAINGCCLTVAQIAPGELGFDVVAQTLGATNLGGLITGELVHVERSLRVGDRLSGHFVQGHIDGVATLVDRFARGNDTRLRIRPPRALMKYIAPRGSVALDGVSLTVASVDDTTFEVALIPTTLTVTALGRREIGWGFNLETDILGRTIIGYLERRDGHDDHEEAAGREKTLS